MDKETFAIRVPVQVANKVIQTLRRLQLLDDRFEFQRTNRTLVLPIIREPSKNEISWISSETDNIKVERTVLGEVNKRPRDLREAMSTKLPEALTSKLPRSFDVIGDIAILDLPDELEPIAHLVGKAILELNPHLRLVVRKSSDISGTYRTRRFIKIAGLGGTETIYREYSNLLRLDIASVYFSPRLAHERMRVASQVNYGERVLDMFTGVGPYSILIAKTQPNSVIYSIDINPEAFRYLRENILLNHVADRVVPILGDARTIVTRSLQKVTSRVIMNLPSESIKYVDAALNALQDGGGVVHFYAFTSRNETIDHVVDSVRTEVERHGKKIRSLLHASVLKEVAPNRIQIAMDLDVQ